MLPYSNDNLQSDLQVFLSRVANVSQSYYIAFNVMFFYGCRFSELRQINRFSNIDSTSFSIIPEKNNNIRTLSKTNLDSVFANFIMTQNQYFSMLNLSTGSYYFKQFYAKKIVYHETKVLTTHLFRHNYAKSLKFQGLTDQQIQLNLGEKDIRNSNNYIYSQLTCVNR
jgi:integrase